MPALPYAVAELPAKPPKPSYDHYSLHREGVPRKSNQPTMWPYSGSGNAHGNGNGYDDRRSQYSSRSSYHQGGSSSSGGGSGGFTSTGQLSPSSSATSTASSLRTPPDLLLNGSSLTSNLTGPFSGQKGMTRLDGKAAGAGSNKDQVHLSIDQLERRLQILSGLSKELLSPELPTPPSSPKPARAKVAPAESKKRKASSSSEQSDDDSSRAANKRRPGEKTTGSADRTRSEAASDDPSLPGIDRAYAWQLPPARQWTKELFFETAVAYRQRGRELKHRGDHRRRDISTNKRLTSSPEKESLIASLEQTDALLLYMYGFWCEDQACGGSCVVANWTSLYGLLKYVYLSHEKSKMPVLAGLCRLLEAVVLRHVASHEMRLMNLRLSKAVSSYSPTSSAHDSASKTKASLPASSDSMQQTLTEVSETMARIVADNERSTRLMQQAKSSVLSLSTLQETYPRIANLCERSMRDRQWSTTDSSHLATRIDPSGGLDAKAASAVPLATGLNSWVWPMDASTPFPLIVCFGRAILRDAAQEAKLSYTMEPVRLS